MCLFISQKILPCALVLSTVHFFSIKKSRPKTDVILTKSAELTWPCAVILSYAYMYIFFPDFFFPLKLFHTLQLLDSLEPYLHTPPLHCLIADWLPKTDFHKSLLEKYDFWQSKWLICVKNTLVN